MLIERNLIDWEKIFFTNFIYPPIFQTFNILGLFSQKIPLFLKISSYMKINLFSKVSLIFPKQIHSHYVVEINSDFSKVPQADSLITNKKLVFLGIKTADCVPILISTKNKEWVAAVHAGWRGSVKGVFHQTLKVLLNKGFNPEEILVAMGPHIKTCCYEVKEDLVEELKIHFENYKEFLIFKEKKFFLSLEKLNLFQAQELGIPFQNIWISQDCTYCLHNLYWSYRFHRNKRGYQISFIGKL